MAANHAQQQVYAAAGRATPTPEEALHAIEKYLSATRKLRFAGFPALPEGYQWSADVAESICLISDEQQENLFLDVLIPHLADCPDPRGLLTIAKQQLSLIEAVALHYRILIDELTFYALAQPETETQE